MRFRLALTLDVRREPPEDVPDRETDLSARDERADPHTGPSLGFRLNERDPEDNA